ncbi:MAG: hypothetical protein ACR2PW_07850 [Gammaproteobacteria bacterium]
MWDTLITNSLANLPEHLATLDPATKGRLQRYAGTSISVRLPVTANYLQLLIDDAGTITATCTSQPDAEADIHLQSTPPSFSGNRPLALRLLSILRRYRPELGEWLEIWFGSAASGAITPVATAAHHQASKWLSALNAYRND